MRIAYVGPGWGTSLQRLRALERLGHHMSLVDPESWLSTPRWRRRLHHHTAFLGTGALINGRLRDAVSAARPDLVWVNQGEFIGPKAISDLRKLGVPIVNYANDNPFSAENRRRFRSYRAALPLYDLVVVVFADAVEAARRYGARRVIRKFICADEVAHRPTNLPDDLKQQYASEVAFVGTWMKQRGPFIAELVGREVPLSLWGDRWQRAREWPMIRRHWRGPGVYDDEGYAAIIQSAKICLGLVNKSSGNLHTARSIQIPSLGSLLCAERTSEHLTLYENGKEAVFWDDAMECAELCHRLLRDDATREEIAQRGHQRALRNNLFNEPVLTSILEEALR